jgi:hypothetical protein
LDPFDDDLRYTCDLGLIAPNLPVRVANPIYHEVIARVLTANAEATVIADPRAFVLPDGRFDMDLLLREFAAFWREHAEVLVSGTVYHEVAPQLVLMGFCSGWSTAAGRSAASTVLAAAALTCSFVGPTPLPPASSLGSVRRWR